MGSVEPWRRFEPKVDPDGVLPPRERARRAKISYRAFQRANAKKAAKARLAAKHRREAALRRWLVVHPTAEEVAAFARERHEEVGAQILLAAAGRGVRGIIDLRKRQRQVRADCILCGRPFV